MRWLYHLGKTTSCILQSSMAAQYTPWPSTPIPVRATRPPFHRSNTVIAIRPFHLCRRRCSPWTLTSTTVRPSRRHHTRTFVKPKARIWHRPAQPQQQNPPSKRPSNKGRRTTGNKFNRRLR
ncbi:unnamed protein product, partial [Prunus brigantina]